MERYIAYPIGRERRCNPMLIPLILLRTLLFLSLLGALISAIIIPKILKNYDNEVPQRFMNIRIAGIVMFSIAIGVTLFISLLEFISCCALKGSRKLSIFANFLDLIMSLGVLGVSVPLILSEFLLATSLFTNAVDQNLFLAAGILGLISVLFYILDLFLSRFYQFLTYRHKTFRSDIFLQPTTYTNSMPVANPASYAAQPSYGPSPSYMPQFGYNPGY